MECKDSIILAEDTYETGINFVLHSDCYAKLMVENKVEAKEYIDYEVYKSQLSMIMHYSWNHSNLFLQGIDFDTKHTYFHQNILKVDKYLSYQDICTSFH